MPCEKLVGKMLSRLALQVHSLMLAAAVHSTKGIGAYSWYASGQYSSVVLVNYN